jgi:hypothetical protein
LPPIIIVVNIHKQLRKINNIVNIYIIISVLMLHLILLAAIAYFIWDKVQNSNSNQNSGVSIVSIDCVDCKAWNHRDALSKCEVTCQSKSGKYTNKWRKKDDSTISCECNIEQFTL